MASIKSSAVFVALGLVRITYAWYNELPPCLSEFDPFVYSGCYDNGQRGQTEALSLRTDLDTQNMTVETCVAECKGNGYRFAGLGYYGVCYCGQTVSTALLDEPECSFPCTGNSSQTCGGDTQVNLWMDPTFLDLDDQTTDDYVSVGCWTDDSSEGKALFYRQDSLESSTMTTETCLNSCLAGGYPFAGTEYGGECYCGVVIGNGTALASDATTCNMPCNGNANQTCGGPSRLSLYLAKDLQSLEPCGWTPPADNSSTSSTTSTASSTSISSTTSSTTVSTTSTVVTTTSSTISSTIPSTTSTSSTTAPITSTIPITSTSCTTKVTSTTISSVPVCTTAVVTPPTCEYKCGNWCSKPIPEFNDFQSCTTAWSQCAIQVASCFLKAGMPGATDCFKFGEWCGKISSYCVSNCKGKKCGGKGDCFKGAPPSGGGSPTTSVSTYPCTTLSTKTATTATSTVPTSSCAVPTPTGICKQPSSSAFGYGTDNPVGGIKLPLVTCNNLEADWRRGNVFKLYTDSDSAKCRSYSRGSCGNACSDACYSQFQQCEDVYVEGCKTSKQSTGRYAQNWVQADLACKAQYYDCLQTNKYVKDNGKCNTWAGNWVN
ncbi:WSC domain-containing protein [Camillea tinctor]|nr:WSC domain-containing protein [Camillea tinctor]